MLADFFFAPPVNCNRYNTVHHQTSFFCTLFNTVTTVLESIMSTSTSTERVCVLWYTDPPARARYTYLDISHVLLSKHAREGETITNTAKRMIVEKTPLRAVWWHMVSGKMKNGGEYDCLLISVNCK